MSLRSLMSLLYLSPKLMWWGPYAGDLFTKSSLYLRRLLHCLPLCFLSLVYTFTPPTSKTTVVCFPCPMRSARRSAVFTCGHTSSVTLSPMCVVSDPHGSCCFSAGFLSFFCDFQQHFLRYFYLSIPEGDWTIKIVYSGWNLCSL